MFSTYRSLLEKIKLLEIDLADAKLRLEQAESAFSRATQLREKGAIANEQYEQARVAQRLAESQYQRAQLLLELYRKALPRQETPAKNDQSTAEPKFKGVWMTDFAAAREKAAKTNRPLIMYFWAGWAQPSYKMKVEVLLKTELLRFVTENFVPVIVDVDAFDNKQILQRFKVRVLPTVLLLGADGRELTRTEGLMTAGALVDVLKKVVPLSQIDAPVETPAKVDPARPAAEEKPGAPRPGGNDPVSGETPRDAAPISSDPDGSNREM